MKDYIQTLLSLVPFLQQYPTWVKTIVSIWVLITAITIIGLLFFRKPPGYSGAETNPQPPSPSSTSSDTTPKIYQHTEGEQSPAIISDNLKIIQQPKGDQSPAVIVAPGGSSIINYNAPPISKGHNEIFVTPNSFTVNGGRNEMFILKITNNKDISLYDVYLLLEITNGDLTTNQIKIEPLGAPKVEGKLGDEKGSVIIDWAVYFMHMIAKGKTYPTLMQATVNNINPHSTRDFRVSIEAEKNKSSSNIDFKITHISEKPNPIISGPMPKEEIKPCSENDTFDGAYEKGKKFLNQGNFPECIKCFEKTIKLDPSSVKAHTNLGVAYLQNGKNDSAINEWKTAIELDPNAPEPQFNMGVLLMKNSDFKGAIQQFERTSNLDNLMIKYDSLCYWGICLKKLNQQEGAYEKYRLAIDLNPKYARAYFQWGADLLDQGRYNEAIKQFEKCSELNDAFRLDALGLWGLALERMGKPDEAIEKYNKVIPESCTKGDAPHLWSQSVF